MSQREHTFYKTLYEVARIINSSLEPGVVLSTIAEQVAKAMGAKACTIRLLDKTHRFLLASAAHGLSKGYLRKGAVEVAKSGVDKEVLSGKVVFIKDACNDPRFQYPEAAKTEGIASILVAPLMSDGEKAIGVLRVYSGTIREFEADEVEFLTVMANLSAIALENARLHQALKADYDMLTAFEYRMFED